MKVHPVTETKLLLVAVLASTVVSSLVPNWLVIGAGAFVAGAACGRVVRLMQRACA